MAHATPYAVAWRLYQAHVPVGDIAHSLSVHRATVYRWLKEIRFRGLRLYERWMRTCMTRKRQLRLDPRIRDLVLGFRRKIAWCGQKIQWWLRRTHNLVVSVATIYRILGTTYQLRSKWQRRQVRGPVPRATRPREVLQMDTIDLGGLHVLTVVDIYTREALALPLRSLHAQSVADWLPTLRRHFGPITTLQTDNGKEFMGQFRAKLQTWARHYRTIHPGRKEENGYVESFNRTVRSYGVGWRTWQPSEYRHLADTLQEFCRFYNEETPHLSLNLQTPQQFALSHLH